MWESNDVVPCCPAPPLSVQAAAPDPPPSSSAKLSFPGWPDPLLPLTSPKEKHETLNDQTHTNTLNKILILLCNM